MVDKVSEIVIQIYDVILIFFSFMCEIVLGVEYLSICMEQ